MNANERQLLATLLGGDRGSWQLGLILVSAVLLLLYAFPPPASASERDSVSVVVVGELLAVRNETGKISQVRLRKADGRYLRVELDGHGALLGVKHSGSFVEVSGQVYLKLTGADQIRWIRVTRFRVVPRPPDWIEPELICHEPEGEPEALEQPDAGELEDDADE